jgi:hypothetical protein
MNRKEDRLLTPPLSSIEEEREKMGAGRFRGSMREISFRVLTLALSPLRGEGIRSSRPGSLIVSRSSEMPKLRRVALRPLWARCSGTVHAGRIKLRTLDAF